MIWYIKLIIRGITVVAATITIILVIKYEEMSVVREWNIY